MKLPANVPGKPMASVVAQLAVYGFCNDTLGT
jgi:hypothetical protein